MKLIKAFAYLQVITSTLLLIGAIFCKVLVPVFGILLASLVLTMWIAGIVEGIRQKK